METEAGGPGSGSKKRKRHAMRTKQGGRGPGSVSKKRKPAPVATPAAAEVRAASDQGPPPGSGEYAAGRISLIPDAILGEIVSLLPTKEGARTQLLASRWRHIWSSAPLNLDSGSLAAPIEVDCGGEATRKSDLDGVVSRILTSHQGPIRRLCIPTGPTAEAYWLQSPTLDNLEQLEFSYLQDCGPKRSSWDDRILPVPPPCTFRFAATLRLANIGKCHLPDSIVHGLHFPQLKHLRLHWVCISEWSIHHMIAGCPALECLMIYFVFGVNRLKINALRLRIIGMRTYSHDYWSTAEPRLGAEYSSASTDTSRTPPASGQAPPPAPFLRGSRPAVRDTTPPAAAWLNQKNDSLTVCCAAPGPALPISPLSWPSSNALILLLLGGFNAPMRLSCCCSLARPCEEKGPPYCCSGAEGQTPRSNPEPEQLEDMTPDDAPGLRLSRQSWRKTGVCF
ncbi:hypothetical protein QYE76_036599 [Lolium multiflorum]|uniref:F-box/LRR-repeat protein 15/At3g58940/PEG3-like LRR domain-containing protein n=1 Tax=Lolium multiflorum TaxID=4521 RepID=A0AAD8R2U1_LOLMU|nr:hypothetical protein QYE76_036599 [Lolium multiflorum]